MCEEIEENRRTLARLIRSHDSFTERELADEYKRARGTYGVDGYRGVIGHLRLLREYGQLRFRNGRYIVRSSK
jgi:hypothetical protein